MTPREGMTRAIKAFGTQKKLGAAIGYTQAAVWYALHWRASITIETATGASHAV